MSRQSKQFYEFGPFCLDVHERQLTREGKPIALTPKAYQTLLVLVQKSGEIVEKEELMRAVWPDAFVEDGGLTRNISVLRKALENGGAGAYIKTIPRRGYRFAGKVRRRVEKLPTLRWLNSAGEEESLPLGGEEIVIGRSSEADLVLANAYVSRRHAKLVKGPEGHAIVDLESSHGTFVNGQRIARCDLQSGDRLSLGKDRVDLVYCSDEGETAGKTTDRQGDKSTAPK